MLGISNDVIPYPASRKDTAMATKKLQKSIDTVKGDVRELVEAFWAFREEVMTQRAVSAAERQSASSGGAPAEDALALAADGSTGVLRVIGYYEMPDGAGAQASHQWSLDDYPVEQVLSLPVEDAARVLAAVGHKQRLGIILMLLRCPATANEMVQALSLGTTGAAYHHLNVLQGTGLVEQAQRGVFSIVPERVPALLTILGGLSGAIRAEVGIISDTPEEPPSESADA